MTDIFEIFNQPQSVAIVGASNDPEKIGGRPLRYLKEFKYQGEVFAVNPRRSQVQGIDTVSSLDALKTVPDVALIAVPGESAVQAVETAAGMGVKGCVVMSSGFSEVGTVDGVAMQQRMVEAAKNSGMRLVGPNTQGLANFDSGTVLGFSTMFTEVTPSDGQVGIISQSGAMAAIPYGLLRHQGVGVRYVHATGNDADVCAAELATETLNDPGLKLLLVYLENVGDSRWLIALGEKSQATGVPVIILIGGRSQEGSKAAASHTGALATERRVLDAFLVRVGLYQVHNVREMTDAANLYLQGWRPKGKSLAIVSNSGAVCVLGADSAEDEGLPLAQLTERTRAQLKDNLPAFASPDNPIDVTAALLTDSGIFGRILPVLAQDAGVDACLLAIPVAGRGYDVRRFAADAEKLAATGMPVVVATPQQNVAATFRAEGLPVFSDESSATAALGQFLKHRELMDAARQQLSLIHI